MDFGLGFRVSLIRTIKLLVAMTLMILVMVMAILTLRCWFAGAGMMWRWCLGIIIFDACGLIMSFCDDRIRANFMLRKLRCCSRVWELS